MKEREHLAITKLPTVVNELQDAVLLGDFENGSEEWHELRNEAGAVGGSDIGAIAGLSQWESPYTKWAKKTKQIPDGFEPNMSMRLGTKLEAPILEIFAEEHPELEIYTTGTWANKDEPWMRANPDGLYADKTGEFGIVEVKFSRDYWTQVPQSYRAQVLWYMRVFGIRQAKLVALAGSSYQEFDIEWDQFEADALFAAAMSSLSSSLNALASTTLYDVIIPYRKKVLSAVEELSLSRGITLVWGIVLSVSALIFASLQLQAGERPTVVELGLGIASYTYGGLLGAFLLGLISNKAQSRDALTGFFSGLISLLFMVNGPVQNLLPGEPLALAWPLYTAVGAAIVVLVGEVSARVRKNTKTIE